MAKRKNENKEEFQEECPTCNGSGYLETPGTTPEFEVMSNVITCPTCKGTGIKPEKRWFFPL